MGDVWSATLPQSDNLSAWLLGRERRGLARFANFVDLGGEIFNGLSRVREGRRGMVTSGTRADAFSSTVSCRYTIVNK